MIGGKVFDEIAQKNAFSAQFHNFPIDSTFNVFIALYFCITEEAIPVVEFLRKTDP